MLDHELPRSAHKGEMNLWKITFFWDTSSVTRFIATPGVSLADLARTAEGSGLLSGVDGKYDIQAAEYLGKVVVDGQVLSGALAHGT